VKSLKEPGKPQEAAKKPGGNLGEAEMCHERDAKGSRDDARKPEKL